MFVLKQLAQNKFCSHKVVSMFFFFFFFFFFSLIFLETEFFKANDIVS